MSELGSQVSLLALPLVAVNRLHAGAFQVGLLTSLATAAFLLVGLPAGTLVDRLSRRRVMITADAGRAATLATIPVAYGLGGLTLAQLYVVAFVSGVLTVFFDVAYQSYLPSLVGPGRLVETNAKLTGSAQVAQVGGPSLAGGLVQAIGGQLAVAVDAASYVASVVAVTAIGGREPPPERAASPGLRREMAEGVRYVLTHPLLRVIAATTATSNLFSAMVTAVEVVFLVRVIHLAPALIGLVFAAGGLGGILGALSASAVARRIGGARATVVGISASAGSVLIPLTTPGAGVALFAVGQLCLGFGSVLYNVNQVSFRQRLCPPALLGRMNATMRFVVWGVMPVGALIGGAAGSAIGLRPTLWVGTVGSTLAVGWLLGSPIRRMRDFPDT